MKNIVAAFYSMMTDRSYSVCQPQRETGVMTMAWEENDTMNDNLVVFSNIKAW